MAKKNRRAFIKKSLAGGMGIAGLSSGLLAHQPTILKNPKRTYSANDQLNIAFIGVGIQGYYNINACLQNPGTRIVAACDLYQGRVDSVRERHGHHIKITRNYDEILNMPDVDAVCIATSDHWHDHITIAALEAGKHVYCEKPMVHKLEEGHAVIKAEKKSGKVLQIGSQRASGIDTLKAKELYEKGMIGELILAEFSFDRNSAIGAWQYAIPTDASPDTVDWDRYIGDAPKRPYDANRFFRWRNYQDYGTGVAGDLFVHMFTTLHIIVNSLGPERILATGGLRYWKDGRDVPDITLGLYDYPKTANHPAFNVQFRVNFADGAGGGSTIKLVGTEGAMTLGWDSFTLQKNKIETVPHYQGYDSYMTFTKIQQAEYEKWFAATYKKEKTQIIEPQELEYKTPEGYSSHVDHWWNFLDAIRNNGSVVENGTFGLRAAGPSLATNNSYFEDRIIKWDPNKMIITN